MSQDEEPQKTGQLPKNPMERDIQPGDILEAVSFVKPDGSRAFAPLSQIPIPSTDEMREIFPSDFDHYNSRSRSDLASSKGLLFKAGVVVLGAGIVLGAKDVNSVNAADTTNSENSPAFSLALDPELQEQTIEGLLNIPVVEVNIGSGTNLRTLPSTQSEALVTLSNSVNTMIKGQVQKDDGTWYYANYLTLEGENKQVWLREDTLQVSEVQSVALQSVWNLDDISRMPVLDEFGNLTTQTLMDVGTQVDLADTKAAFGVLGLPPQTVDNVGILAVRGNSVVFLQTADVVVDESRVNEKGFVISVDFANLSAVFLGEGQLRDVFTNHQIPGDFTDAHFTADGTPEGYLRFGDNVLFDINLFTASIADAVPQEQALADSAIVVEGVLPQGSFNVTPESIVFANGQSFEIQGEEVDSLQLIRTATPEPLTVAMIPESYVTNEFVVASSQTIEVNIAPERYTPQRVTIAMSQSLRGTYNGDLRFDGDLTVNSLQTYIGEQVFSDGEKEVGPGFTLDGEVMPLTAAETLGVAVEQSLWHLYNNQHGEITFEEFLSRRSSDNFEQLRINTAEGDKYARADAPVVIRFREATDGSVRGKDAVTSHQFGSFTRNVDAEGRIIIDIYGFNEIHTEPAYRNVPDQYGWYGTPDAWLLARWAETTLGAFAFQKANVSLSEIYGLPYKYDPSIQARFNTGNHIADGDVSRSWSLETQGRAYGYYELDAQVFKLTS